MRTLIFLLLWLSLPDAGFTQSVSWWQRPYLTLEAGGLKWLNGVDAHNLMLGLGYQHGDWLGLGVDLGTYSDFANYNLNLRGYSLHYQAQPGRWLLRLSAGNLYYWDRESSSSFEDSLGQAFNPFFKARIAYRPWPFLQVGLMGLLTTYVEIHTYYMGWPPRPHRTFYPQVLTIQPYLGLILPGRRR